MSNTTTTPATPGPDPTGGGPSGGTSNTSTSSTTSASTSSTTTAAGTTSTTTATDNTSKTSTSNTSTTTTPTTTAQQTSAPNNVNTNQPSRTVITQSDPGGGIITITSTINAPSNTASKTAVASSSNKGFFSNTGAVAGVFSVVGVVGIVLLVILLTNALRRRRAKKFDREIEEAAAEAAQAHAPVFLDDERDDYGPNAGAYGAGHLSDVSSHGTYGQSPMSHPTQETYGMREMGPNPGEYYDAQGYGTGAVAAGAAGIGVMRTRSTRDGGYAAGLTDGAAPYPAFVAPQYNNNRAAGNPDYNLLEAAGMSGMGGTSQPTRGRSPPVGGAAAGAHPDLSRNRSLGAGDYYSTAPSKHTTESDYSQPGMGSDPYAAQYQPHAVAYTPSPTQHYNQQPYQPQQQPPMPQPQQYSAQQQAGPSAYSTGQGYDEEDDAYGGMSGEQAERLPNPFTRGSSQGHDDNIYGRNSEDEDAESVRKVLKVANE